MILFKIFAWCAKLENKPCFITLGDYIDISIWHIRNVSIIILQVYYFNITFYECIIKFSYYFATYGENWLSKTKVCNILNEA